MGCPRYCFGVWGVALRAFLGYFGLFPGFGWWGRAYKVFWGGVGWIEGFRWLVLD